MYCHPYFYPDYSRPHVLPYFYTDYGHPYRAKREGEGRKDPVPGLLQARLFGGLLLATAGDVVQYC